MLTEHVISKKRLAMAVTHAGCERQHGRRQCECGFWPCSYTLPVPLLVLSCQDANRFPKVHHDRSHLWHPGRLAPRLHTKVRQAISYAYAMLAESNRISSESYKAIPGTECLLYCFTRCARVGSTCPDWHCLYSAGTEGT